MDTNSRNKVDQRSKTRRALDAKAADIVYTPDLVVEACLKTLHSNIVARDVWLDPFAGEGAFVKKFPKEVIQEFGDIQTGQDFFDRKVGSADWIISNPPFSLINKILSHSCVVARKGFAYLITFKKLTVNRLLTCATHGFCVTKLSLFQIKAPGWQNFLQAFVVFEKGDINPFWSISPFKIPLTNSVHSTSEDSRSQEKFPAKEVAKRINLIKVFGTDRIEEIKNVNESLFQASNLQQSTSTSTIINGALTGVPLIKENFQKCAKEERKMIGVIIDANRLSVSLFDFVKDLGYTLSYITIFEALDTGGYIWVFLIYARESKSQILSFHPVTFSADTPTPFPSKIAQIINL